MVKPPLDKSAQYAQHVPVMLSEVLAAMAIKTGERHVDATFGAGGYSRAMLEARAIVHGFDRDPEAKGHAEALQSQFPEKLVFHAATFSNLSEQLRAANITTVDGIVFDIGVSSMQLDQPERGFSFREDGPLDMRMAQDGESAADFLNNADENVIADILFTYGEERQSRRIARAIVAARPLTRTRELVQVIHKVLGYHSGMKKDPATRSFQAIRIHVNQELEELRKGLLAAEDMLAPGGRLVVVSFHSLEDRVVKQFLRKRSGKVAGATRHMPIAPVASNAPSFLKPAKAVRASEDECLRNPRARSAILRSAIRTDAPAWKEAA
jgi:16S rRNA (cytosine1402-N4)-methyltransferase